MKPGRPFLCVVALLAALLVLGMVLTGGAQVLVPGNWSPSERAAVLEAARQRGIGPGGGAIPWPGPRYTVTNFAGGISTNLWKSLQSFPNAP